MNFSSSRTPSPCCAPSAPSCQSLQRTKGFTPRLSKFTRLASRCSHMSGSTHRPRCWIWVDDHCGGGRLRAAGCGGVRGQVQGQVGVATQFFSTFKAAMQRRLLQALLPLSFGFALKIISWRAQFEQKRKYSSATTVLWLVRSARDALLRGEVHEYLTKKEQLMMSAMRLGVLQTTEGIAEG